MSGKEVAEQRACSSGSIPGTISHAYIQHPPLRCGIPETHGIYYDDGNRLILSPTSGQLLSWKVGAQSEPPESDNIGEGPVLSVRYSLDKRLIAVQRSDHELLFKNRETGEAFIHICKAETERILGFFWTDCPSYDVVLVKTSGLDLLSYEPRFNRLHLVESKRLNVNWYIYTHGSRLVLLASGMQCKLFSGFQFSSAGIVRLPKFEMKLAKAESNHKPALSAEEVNIVTIYGRIYCLQVDKVDMQLHVYRFYRDAVVHQGTLPIYSKQIAVSVVDNVLLVHQVDAKVVILYDIFLDSLAPVSAPLPLSLRGSFGGTSSSQAGSSQKLPLESVTLIAHEGTMYGDSWNFLIPDLICNVEHGLVWKIQLDLEAIAASSSEVPYLLEFLQRRRSEPMKAKHLCLMMLRNVILERRPIPMISRALSIIMAAYSQDAKVQNAFKKDAGRLFSDGGDPSNVYDQKDMEGKTERDIAEYTQPIDISSTSNAIRREETACGSEGRVINDIRKTSESIPESCSSISNSSVVGEVTQDISIASPELVEPSSMVSTCSDTRDSITSAVISPSDMYNYVFSLVEEEMGGEPTYLVAVIIELLRSAVLEKVFILPKVYVMMVKLLARSNRFPELVHFVSNKVIEPSKQVAFQLLDIGNQSIQARKLGLDMLRQLSLHNEYLQKLLQCGYYLDALVYVRKRNVKITQPFPFLEAAFSANNQEHLAAVLRFFSDYIPGFRNTSEFRRYSHVLNEVC